MSSFKERVDSAIASELFIGSVVYQEYARTSTGQQVGFIVTKAIWYALRCYVDDNQTDDNVIGFYPLYQTGHATLSGAKDQIRKYIEQLSRKPPYFKCGSHSSTSESVCTNCVKYKKLSKECTNNPDKFLNPGDHITVCRGVYSHDAIYAGNRMVYQVSPGEGDSKSAKVSTHAKLEPWEKFTQNKQETIHLVVYVIRYRTAQEIIESAKQFCDACYGKSQYNLWNNNCQHYASKCSTGFEWSYEARNSIKKRLF